MVHEETGKTGRMVQKVAKDKKKKGKKERKEEEETEEEGRRIYFGEKNFKKEQVTRCAQCYRDEEI